MNFGTDTSPNIDIKVEACKNNPSKCRTGLCPSNKNRDFVCCNSEGIAPAPVPGTGVGDGCSKTNPSWSCMDINNCDLDLFGKTTITDKRKVCTASTNKCVTGACKGGAEIVCCEPKCGGKCTAGEYCSLGKCVPRCQVAAIDTDTVCNAADTLKSSWCVVATTPPYMRFDHSKKAEIKTFCESKKNQAECQDTTGDNKASIFCWWPTDEDVKRFY